jgi:hypothetical protein
MLTARRRNQNDPLGSLLKTLLFYRYRRLFAELVNSKLSSRTKYPLARHQAVFLALPCLTLGAVTAGQSRGMPRESGSIAAPFVNVPSPISQIAIAVAVRWQVFPVQVTGLDEKGTTSAAHCCPQKTRRYPVKRQSLVHERIFVQPGAPGSPWLAVAANGAWQHRKALTAALPLL